MNDEVIVIPSIAMSYINCRMATPADLADFR